MIKNYFKIALRNLFRNKVFSLINISGLSLGLACCMLIFLYIKDEVSYDRFHEKKDNLYQLTNKVINKQGKVSDIGIAAMIQGPSFKQEIPEIEACVRVQTNNFIIKKDNETFYEDASWVDENFFSVFSFPLLEGNSKTVLSDIHSVVLTDETAEKYFGKTNPIGKTLAFEIQDKFETFVVTGIAKKSPQNSSIKFKILLPYNYQIEKNPDNHWLNFGYPTFFVLNPKADLKAVEDKMAKIFDSKAKNEIQEETKHGFQDKIIFGLTPLTSMHLSSTMEYVDEISNPIYSYILSCIALFILLIACINFVNLTIAQSLRRRKEIGIRKVVGGQRKQLIIQFLGESFVVCFISFSLAFVLAQLALPLFNELANKRLSLSYLFDYQLIMSFLGLFLLTTFAAGFYPALVLSGFDPVKTLYNRFQFSSKNYLSKSLVVLQFVLAIFMTITTFFIYSQFDFLTHKSLGYNDKNLMILHVGQDENRKLMAVFKNEFAKVSGIQEVASRQNGFWGTNSKANGRDIPVSFEHIDEAYLSTLQISLAEGRNFSKDFPTDSTNSVLVNEAYVKEAGWNDSGVGKTIDYFNGKKTKLSIVGVVKDYHYGSLKEKIRPQLFTAQPDMPYGRFLLRIDPKNRPKTIAAVEKIYRALVPYRPFKYDFMEDLNLDNYESEAKWKQIIIFGAILMIFISCIGLFGLTMLSIQQRTKEIGVRKVLGANVLQISSLLSKNYIVLVFIAFIFAIPAAWFATYKWLENFAYRIDITWWIFALAGFMALLVALLTVSFQAIKAAVANPVKSLRTE
jgi:putative ABC transport system permease protein